LRQDLPIRYEIDRRVFPGRRPACWADPRWLGRFADVVENPLKWSGFGDEDDDV
jgi:hypothetical protein